jgi:hypothetical protein
MRGDTEEKKKSLRRKRSKSVFIHKRGSITSAKIAEGGKNGHA